MARIEAYPDMGPEDVSFETLERALPPGWELGALEYEKNGKDHFDWCVYLGLVEKRDGTLKWKKMYRNRQFQVVLTRAWLDHVGAPIKWNYKQRCWERVGI